VSIWTTLPANIVPSPAIPVLSVGNLKGGVGKTSIVANLAMTLAQSGIRVLAIDLDFQASLSVALPSNVMPRSEKFDGAVQLLLGAGYDMFHDVRLTGRGVRPFSELSLVRTSFALADVEDRLFAAFILKQNETDPRFALARVLSEPSLRKDFDLVIIDTPPRLTTASINALCASTHVLIPTSLTPMSRSGAVTFVEYLKEFRKSLCPSLSILGVLPTFTHGKLTDPELKIVDELGMFIGNDAIWRDIFVPVRQAVADNKVQQNAECREIFQKLAKKVAEKLGLRPDGRNEGRRAHPSFRIGGAGLSQ
jgi:chromosome partitioning protein